MFSFPYAFSQKVYEPGLTDLEPEGITNVITDIAISPDNKTICLAGYYNRAYLFDVSQPGKIKPIWKVTDVKGMTSGSIASFSKDGKYIIMKGFKTTTAKVRQVMFSKFPKAWQNSDDVCILDATTGATILNVSNAFAISVSGNTAFVSDKDGFKWYSLPDGKETKLMKVEDNENAAISPSGKYIVECWDADKESLKQIPSVIRRKAELKNAYRAKKLLVIYKTDNMNEPLAVSSDEIDVVTDIQFDEEEKFVYLQMQLGGEEHSNDPNMFVFQRVQLTTGKIDGSFGIKGNYCKISPTGKVSSIFAGGMLGQRKQLRVQDPANTNDYAVFESKIKLFKPSTYLNPAVLSGTPGIAYVYYEKQLFEWDYNKVKKYYKKAAGASEEELAEKADSLLDKSIEEGKLSKDIKKYGITGDYIMDITIVGPKGMVQTVFCESDDKTDIKMQNALKDLIRKQEFDVGLPKDRRLKFRYTFQL
jgi:WD40 repeat protein